MPISPRSLPLALVVAGALAVPAPAGAVTASSSAWKLVVHGRYKAFRKVPPKITYASSHGSFTAAWIGTRHYRLSGRLDGKALSGSFRTRQAAGGKRFTARGSGKLGSRRVRISGSGPNTLKSTTLVLR